MTRESFKRLSIYIDGAARGNPGPAGAGIVIRYNAKSAVKKISRYIGTATNNVAEYKALILGLEEARSLGAADLTINTDSELIAKQLGGEYKIKNQALKELYAKAVHILDSFDEVRVNQIPRSENREADKLANKALGSARGRKVGRSFILRSKSAFASPLF